MAAWTIPEAGRGRCGARCCRVCAADSAAAIILERLCQGQVCRRWPDGRRITRGPGWCEPGSESAEADFDYTHDPEGLGCPFGSHARRMNPRLPAKLPNAQAAGDVVHARRRPLIRRGHPYGALWSAPSDDAEPAVPDDTPRGMLGMFCCAGLEDQFEHLLGQWAERPVLGVDDRGDAKDPMMGQHDDPESRFHVPLPDRQSVDLARSARLRAHARHAVPASTPACRP